MVKNIVRALLVIILFSPLFSLSYGHAENFSKNNVTVESPTVQASLMAPHRAVGYALIHNGGFEDEHLISVTSPISNRIEIQEAVVEYGRTYMHRIKEPIKIAPNDYLELKQDSCYIVFFNLRDDLRDDEVIPAKLHFEKAGDIDVNFIIVSRQDPTKEK